MAGANNNDPYFPGEGGWVEEDPEEDPEEILEEDPEEDPEEDADSDMDMDVDGDVPSDSSTDSESEESGLDIGDPEVIDEPYPIRDRDTPLPPPSLQTYRYPNGGPLWRLTPRKRVPIPRPNGLQTVVPAKEQSEVPSTYKKGQSSRAPLPTPDLSAAIERARLATETRVSNMDAQVHRVSRELIDCWGETQVTSVRVRRIDEDCTLNEEAIQITRDELAEETAQRRAMEERMAGFEQRTLAAETGAAAAQQQADQATRALREMAELLARHLGV
jgi:hypothetical protein